MNFKKQLHVATRNTLKVYDKERDVNLFLKKKKMISEGYFQVIENHLIAEMDFIPQLMLPIL